MTLIICLFWVLCGFFCYGFLNDDLRHHGIKDHRIIAATISLFGPCILPKTLEILLNEDVKFRL